MQNLIQIKSFKETLYNPNVQYNLKIIGIDENYNTFQLPLKNLSYEILVGDIEICANTGTIIVPTNMYSGTIYSNKTQEVVIRFDYTNDDGNILYTFLSIVFVQKINYADTSQGFLTQIKRETTTTLYNLQNLQLNNGIYTPNDITKLMSGICSGLSLLSKEIDNVKYDTLLPQASLQHYPIVLNNEEQDTINKFLQSMYIFPSRQNMIINLSKLLFSIFTVQTPDVSPVWIQVKNMINPTEISIYLEYKNINSQTTPPAVYFSDINNPSLGNATLGLLPDNVATNNPPSFFFGTLGQGLYVKFSITQVIALSEWFLYTYYSCSFVKINILNLDDLPSGISKITYDGDPRIINKYFLQYDILSPSLQNIYI